MQENQFDITYEQYKAGIKKLWDAMKITSVQDTDVFTLCAERISALEEATDRHDRLSIAMDARLGEARSLLNKPIDFDFTS